MGIFSYIFGGGNIGLIVDSITKHHERLGDPRQVFQIYYNDYSDIDRSTGPKRWKCAEARVMMQDGEIKNYTDLAILALFVDAAPENNSYWMVYQNLADSITKKFRNKGINENLISGNCLTD
jgi:hypothetical protein